MSLLLSSTHRVMRNFKPSQVEFDVFPRSEVETATVVISGYSGSPTLRLAGLMLVATPAERERYMQAQAVVNHVLVVEGAPAINVGDRLVRVRDGRFYYVADVVDPMGAGISTRLLLEERPDAQA